MILDLDVYPHRVTEALALLPMLHVPVQKGLVVAAVGPYADVMVAESSRWPDVSKILVTHQPDKRLRDRRIEYVSILPAKEVDVLLLSPEQDPEPWIAALRPNGLIQASTVDPRRFQQINNTFRTEMGHTVPWREHLPLPLYGAMARAGPEAPSKRVRQPPKSARRLSKNYLPSLFVFGKDEIALALKQEAATQNGASV